MYKRQAVTPSDLPQSALHYVIRTRQRVLLDDASVANLYSDDEYPVSYTHLDVYKRQSTATREALKELACLGNIAEIRLLELIRGETAEALHATLWEAVHAGIVFRLESAYKFLHDSIQEAAYALIPEELRADRHLRIARLLVANLTPDELGERLFEIANQFNRSATLLTDPAEASQVAAIHLRAGRRAKASGAYESAHAHLMSATALLNEYNWANQYDSTFETWMAVSYTHLDVYKRQQ